MEDLAPESLLLGSWHQQKKTLCQWSAHLVKVVQAITISVVILSINDLEPAD